MASYNEVTNRADRGEPITGGQQVMLEFVQAILPFGFDDLMPGEQQLWLEALRQDMLERPGVFVSRHKAALEEMASEGQGRLREIAEEILERGER